MDFTNDELIARVIDFKQMGKSNVLSIDVSMTVYRH
jgi:hypothetical protein